MFVCPHIPTPYRKLVYGMDRKPWGVLCYHQCFTVAYASGALRNSSPPGLEHDLSFRKCCWSTEVSQAVWEQVCHQQ